MFTILVYSEKEHIKTGEGVDFNVCGNYPIYHSHKFWEFIFTFYPYTHKINNKMDKILGDTLIIIKPSDCHCFLDCTKPISQANFKISDSLLKKLCQTFSPDLYDFLLNTPVEQLYQKVGESFSKEIKNYTDLLLITPMSNKNATFYKFIICRFLMYLYQHNFFKKKDKTLPDSVQNVMKILSSPSNFQSKLNELLINNGYSYSQISRIFQKSMGQTLNDYFLQTKMQYAANQILSGNYKIIEISNFVGYNSQSHFDEAFKKQFGVTPLQYKNMQKTLPLPPTGY